MSVDDLVNSYTLCVYVRVVIWYFVNVNSILYASENTFYAKSCVLEYYRHYSVVIDLH